MNTPQAANAPNLPKPAGSRIGQPQYRPVNSKIRRKQHVQARPNILNSHAVDIRRQRSLIPRDFLRQAFAVEIRQAASLRPGIDDWIAAISSTTRAGNTPATPPDTATPHNSGSHSGQPCRSGFLGSRNVIRSRSLQHTRIVSPLKFSLVASLCVAHSLVRCRSVSSQMCWPSQMRRWK